MVNLNYFFIILLTQLLRGIAHITNNLHAYFNLCLIVFCFLRQGFMHRILAHNYLWIPWIPEHQKINLTSWLYLTLFNFTGATEAEFCYLFPLIGEGSQTHNFHLLRHLTYFVRLFGPLWVYSCFGFEALNGFLTTMIHGTQHIANQVHM